MGYTGIIIGTVIVIVIGVATNDTIRNIVFYPVRIGHNFFKDH